MDQEYMDQEYMDQCWNTCGIINLTLGLYLDKVRWILLSMYVVHIPSWPVRPLGSWVDD